MGWGGGCAGPDGPVLLGGRVVGVRVGVGSGGRVCRCALVCLRRV